MGKPKSAAAPMLPGAVKEQLSPGVGVLLRGGNGGNGADSGEEHKAAVSSINRKRRLVQFSLVSADILLLLAATDILLRRAAPFSASEMILSISCVLTGACLSCLAIWLEEP